MFRTDTDVPVFDLQAEGDLTSFLSSVPARQPDSDTFRLWELAASPHAAARGPAHRAEPRIRRDEDGIAVGCSPASRPPIEAYASPSTIPAWRRGAR